MKPICPRCGEPADNVSVVGRCNSTIRYDHGKPGSIGSIGGINIVILADYSCLVAGATTATVDFYARGSWIARQNGGVMPR